MPHGERENGQCGWHHRPLSMYRESDDQLALRLYILTRNISYPHEFFLYK
jgi:hypothetical protein